ncbi:MAG: hypothetical protein JWN57_813, partial [Frankiales bacterium]|nr:hypothetical protein [Frankiales bacterium]
TAAAGLLLAGLATVAVRRRRLAVTGPQGAGR